MSVTTITPQTLSALIHFGNVVNVEGGTQAWDQAGLTFAGITETCGMGMLLARMPWNQVPKPASAGNVASGTACAPRSTCCG